MNKEDIKGKFQEGKGVLNEKAGQFTGDEKKESQGLGQQIKGKVQQGFGDLKEKVTDLKDRAKEKVDETLDKSKRTA